MIDIHAHLLPSVDDGASDLETALAMAENAYKDGIRTVVATPHHANGQYLNPAGEVLPAVTRLKEQLLQAGIPLAVLPGQEIRIYGELLNDLERGELLTLAGSRYLLVEMPSSRVPRNMEEVCHELVIQGYVPVIAHPERNAEVAENPDILRRLIDLGALGQITSQSLAGTFGGKLQKLSLALCRSHYIHVIASDAHDTGRRPFGLSEAYRVVERELGAEARRYYAENAERIIENAVIEPKELFRKAAKRHGLFGFFTRKR